MAYVGLSRAKSLSGIHLANFNTDPKCVIVSRRCLEEINRLRKIYRPDLPLYPVPNPPPTSKNKKCIISASTAVASNLDNVASNRKRKCETKEESPSKVKKNETVAQAQSGSAGSSKLKRSGSAVDRPCKKKRTCTSSIINEL